MFKVFSDGFTTTGIKKSKAVKHKSEHTNNLKLFILSLSLSLYFFIFDKTYKISIAQKELVFL